MIGDVACKPRPQVTMRHRKYSPPESAAAIYWSRFSNPHFAVSGGVIAGGRRPIWHTTAVPIMSFRGAEQANPEKLSIRKLMGRGRDSAGMRACADLP